MSDFKTTVLGCQIDWLTLTATDPKRRAQMYKLGLVMLTDASADGNERKDWHWRGYTGQHCAGVTSGDREDSSILQLGGIVADEQFLPAWSTADGCTRIDLAVTVKVVGGSGNWGTINYGEFCKWRDTNGNPPKGSLITGTDGGCTAYVGSRISDVYGRLYDKAAESGRPEYTDCWRYEVEIKGQPASRTAGYLAACGDRSDWIRRAVSIHFCKRGFRGFGAGDCTPVQRFGVRPASDDTTRLKWLSEQVKPVVDRLIDKGLVSEVVRSLGLPRSVEERARSRYAMEHPPEHDFLQIDGEGE